MHICFQRCLCFPRAQENGRLTNIFSRMKTKRPIGAQSWLLSDPSARFVIELLFLHKQKNDRSFFLLLSLFLETQTHTTRPHPIFTPFHFSRCSDKKKLNSWIAHLHHLHPPHPHIQRQHLPYNNNNNNPWPLLPRSCTRLDSALNPTTPSCARKAPTAHGSCGASTCQDRASFRNSPPSPPTLVALVFCRHTRPRRRRWWQKMVWMH